LPQFLVPCSCGQKLIVGANQAGELIHCRCGKTIEVPTLRELNRLERVVDRRAAPPPATWNKRKGLILLGVVIAVGALATAGFLELRRPPPMEAALLKRRVDHMTPAQAWGQWMQLSAGISQPLSPVQAYYLDQNKIAWNNWTNFFIASLSLAGIGALLLVIGLALPRQPQARTAVPDLH
jgi:hypothetical protein